MAGCVAFPMCVWTSSLGRELHGNGQGVCVCGNKGDGEALVGRVSGEGGWGWGGGGVERHLLVVSYELSCGIYAGGERVLRRHAVGHHCRRRRALQMRLQP